MFYLNMQLSVNLQIWICAYVHVFIDKNLWFLILRRQKPWNFHGVSDCSDVYRMWVKFWITYQSFNIKKNQNLTNLIFELGKDTEKFQFCLTGKKDTVKDFCFGLFMRLWLFLKSWFWVLGNCWKKCPLLVFHLKAVMCCRADC